MKKTVWKKWWFWVIAVFVLFIIISTGIQDKELEEEYRQELAKIASDIQLHSLILADIFKNKPRSLWTTSDRGMVIICTVMIQASYLRAKELVPPFKYKHVHNRILASYKKYDEAMLIIPDAIIYNYDPIAITKATILMEEGLAIQKKVNKEIEILDKITPWIPSRAHKKSS